MQILTLWQPYASFIYFLLKRYETRSWATKYRGTLLIHAAKRKYKTGSFEEAVSTNVCKIAGWTNFERRTLDFSDCNLPLGRIVAIAELTDCIQMTESFIDRQSKLEIACGDWQVGRYALKLENIRPINQEIIFQGRQKLVSAPKHIIEMVNSIDYAA